MKRIILFAAPFLFFPTSVKADVPPSLFFTSEEVQIIQALAAKTSHPNSETGDIHLGAVFYYAPDDWVLWLQGQKWTPSTAKTDIRVTSVQPDEVRVSLSSASGAPAQDIVLKPYQTYQLSTGKVVEGSLGADPSK